MTKIPAIYGSRLLTLFLDHLVRDEAEGLRSSLANLYQRVLQSYGNIRLDQNLTPTSANN